jgi:hypothetical protein
MPDEQEHTPNAAARPTWTADTQQCLQWLSGARLRKVLGPVVWPWVQMAWTRSVTLGRAGWLAGNAEQVACLQPALVQQQLAIVCTTGLA